jgi:hypothetical protein
MKMPWQKPPSFVAGDGILPLFLFVVSRAFVVADVQGHEHFMEIRAEI